MNTRPPNDDQDYIQIWRALHTIWEGHPKPWVQQYVPKDANQITAAIIDQIDVSSCIVNETYLVCYRAGEVWYSDRKNLEECLVLKIYDGPGEFSDVVEFLEAEAKRLGCCCITVATALAPDDQRVADKYAQFGFTQNAISLHKSL